MVFNIGYVLNYIIATIWILSIACSLIKLRNLDLNPTARATWGAIILLVPLIGVIAFLLISGKRYVHPEY